MQIYIPVVEKCVEVHATCDNFERANFTEAASDNSLGMTDHFAARISLE